MTKEDNIIVPRWFLEVVENTLRIQNSINLDKDTPETCQDRNIHQSLNGIRKLLNEEELTGMERLEKLQPSLPSNIDEAAEEYAYKTTFDHGVRFDSFKAGAEWRDQQIPKLPPDFEDSRDKANYEIPHSLNAFIAFEEGFKAGAEWMAGQGITVDGTFHHSRGYPSVIELKTYLRDYEGADVIVQIRKK